MKIMSKAANIVPHLTNHCVRATSATVLADNDVEARHILAVTGHKSTASIESYNARPSFKQKENMSNILSRFIADETDEAHLAIQYPSTSRALPSISTMVQVNSEVNQQKESQNMVQAPQAFHFHGCNVSITNNNYMR